MANQANQWGLKALAARLLLAPLVAGSLATGAFAQQIPNNVPLQSGTPTRTSSDPKELLKFGRTALAQGQYDAARDYARQAEANNPSGRWGFTSDTPESLIKDVQAAVAKANHGEIEKLMRQSKDLFTRPAKNDAERYANVEQASAIIDRAAHSLAPAAGSTI